MTGVGELCFLIAFVAMIAPPIERALTHHRSAQSSVFAETLARAFPFTPPSPSLDALARRAEAALEQSDMARGIISTAATYDHADDSEQPDA